MKFLNNLSSISGGIFPSTSDRSPVISSYVPGEIFGLGYESYNHGNTFFGDNSVTISGMPLIFAEENRSWGTVCISAASGISLGLLGGISIIGAIFLLSK
jgi:hypothetical protein